MSEGQSLEATAPQSPVSKARSSDVVAIAMEYPLFWERAVLADTRERLGQSVDALDAEADAVLREIWSARKALNTDDGEASSPISGSDRVE